MPNLHKNADPGMQKTNNVSEWKLGDTERLVYKLLLSTYLQLIIIFFVFHDFIL